MSEKITGGCRCGSIRYTIDAQAPYETRICHCRDCQYASGAAFSMVAFYAKDRVLFSGISPKAFSVKGSMGFTVTRSFCPKCGTPLYSEIAELPKLICIKTGSLDSPVEATPTGHMWYASKLPWLHINDALEIAQQNPPVERYL